MFNTIVGAGAAGAGAASRYGFGSGSDQKMRLLAAPAPQHCFFYNANIVNGVPGATVGWVILDLFYIFDQS
jgi:hypothetical protein